MHLLVFLVYAFVLAPLTVRSQSQSPDYNATISIDLNQKIGAINPNIYGQYLEHVQPDDECIYPSIWDEKSPFADEYGLRQDVIAEARELGTPRRALAGRMFCGCLSLA